MFRQKTLRALLASSQRAQSASGYSLARHPPLNEAPDVLKHIYELQKTATKASTSSSSNLNYEYDVANDSAIKVATQLYGSPSEFVTLGVAIDCGARNEGLQLAKGRSLGLTHVIEKLAWKNMAHRNQESVQAELDQIGAVVDCVVAKDITICAMTVAKVNLARGIELLAEAVFQPEITDGALETAVGDVVFELESLIDPTQQTTPLSDAIHSAAYGIGPYAFPKNADASGIKDYTVDDVKSFLKTYYKPERMTVACSGLDASQKDEFSRLVNSSIMAAYQQTSFSDATHEIVVTGDETPKYEGGHCYVRKDFNLDMSIHQLPALTHFSLAFPSPGVENIKEHITMEVIRALWGGGDSFSSGGPGKGMYARLYKDVLSQGVYWSCQSFHYPYKNESLFGVNASCEPHFLSLAIELVMQEFVKLRWQSISEIELARAKNQLKMTTFMKLEQKPQQFEDLVQQIKNRGEWMPPDAWADVVDSITIADVEHVVRKYLCDTAPSIAAVGAIVDMPKYDEVVKAMDHTNKETPGKLPIGYRNKLIQWYQQMRR